MSDANIWHLNKISEEKYGALTAKWLLLVYKGYVVGCKFWVCSNDHSYEP